MIYIDLSIDSNINSLIQIFLDEKTLKKYNSNLPSDIINDLYCKYVISLIKNYFSLRTNYDKLLSKLIDNKFKTEYPFFIVKNIYIN